MLMNRHLGKVPDEAKIDLTNTINLVEIGKRAAQYTVKEGQTLAEPIPESWI